MKNIFLSFCFVSALLVTPVLYAETDEEPTAPADNPQNPPVNPNPCGDGTCDEIEETSGGCPKDCGGEPLPPPDGQKQPPPDEGKQLCGDGTCDEHEKKSGKCALDCDESEM